MNITGNLPIFCWIHLTTAFQKNHLNPFLLIPTQQISNIYMFLGLCSIHQRGLHNIFETFKICGVFLFLSLHKSNAHVEVVISFKGFLKYCASTFPSIWLVLWTDKITILEERPTGGGKTFVESLTLYFAMS